jgi:transposase
MSVIAHYHKVGKKKLQRCYKRQEDGYKGWDQKAHCHKYMIFPDNITPHLAIDESSLSKGELYTFVSSRDKTGRKGKLIAMISSTRSEDIIKTLKRIPLSIRLKVTEVSLDMASNMSKACKEAFPNAILVKDRFHVVRLVTDALQHVRVDQRWKEIDKENDAIKQARQRGSRYKPVLLSNGDTPRQLLARSRYLLYKHPEQWTKTQIHRAALLFQLYPHINEAYRLAWDFRKIYNHLSKQQALKAIRQWLEDVKEVGSEHFNIASDAIINHSEGILAFFNNRSTNAHAESFNAKSIRSCVLWRYKKIIH